MDSVQQHLYQRKQSQKEWVTTETVRLVEEKYRAFSRVVRTMVRCRKVQRVMALCKQAREEDGRNGGTLESAQASPFVKKPRQLTALRVTRVHTFLDERGCPCRMMKRS